VEELRLSDAFGEAESCLEFTAAMYNINKGHNQQLMKQCAILEGYLVLIDKVREYQKKGMALADAVDAAVIDCIKHDVLREYLVKFRNEVTRVLLTEYDAKKQRKPDIRDTREEAREDGIRYLIEACEELSVSREDTRKKLAEKYGIELEKAEYYMEKFWK